MGVKPIVFDNFAFQKGRSIFDKNNCSNHFKNFAASKVSIKYAESARKISKSCSECKLPSTTCGGELCTIVSVAQGYFTATAPHMRSCFCKIPPLNVCPINRTLCLAFLQLFKVIANRFGFYIFYT